MFKSIVVAFDGSAPASKALETAAGLAAAGRARLGVAYVIDVSLMHVPDELQRTEPVEPLADPAPRLPINFQIAPATVLSSMAQLSEESDRAMFQYADFILDQARAHAIECGVDEIETRTLEGDAAEEIVAYARERDADLIVCGNRGFGRVKSLLLGSTSHKIAQLADCSCLTVK